MGGLECRTDEIFEVGEIEHRIAPRTTDEQAILSWQLMQNDRIREHYQTRRIESPREYSIRDDSPLCEPEENKVYSGQLEPGLVLHACPMTKEGRKFLDQGSIQDVAVINQDRGGSSGGAIAGTQQDDSAASPSSSPEEELDSEAACAFGERLCQKTAKDWAAAQQKDETASVAVTCIVNETPSSDITEEGLSTGIDVTELKRLVSQGEIMELPSSEKLLVRRPSRAPDDRPNRNPGQYERLLGDEPVRTYVPLLLRPWVMDCAHKEAIHLGEKVTLGLLQRFYWWIGMAESVKWWIRRCYTCQARKSTRQTVRWPLISLPLPSRPGQMVSFDLLGPLPVTAKGNEYVFLVVDLFSRHAEAYAITKGEKNTEGCAGRLVHDYIPRWGCPHTFLSDRGPEFVSVVCRGVFKMLGSVKKYTSSYHPQTNGMVERLNHTLCQMLSYLIADDQKNWDEVLLHAIAAHNNNVSRGTGLAPNEVHIGRYPRLPMTILEGSGVKGHQSAKRDQLDYLELMRDRQVRAYRLIREEDRLIKAKHQANNEKIYAAMNNRTKFVVGDWAWVYDDHSTITGGGKHVLKPAEGSSARKSFALISKLAHCWSGPYKVLCVGPGKMSDGREVGPKLILLEIRTDEPGRGINARVSVHRCKKCYNPHEGATAPRFLPWSMSNYVLNKYSEISPPFHLTTDDVTAELDTHRVTPRTLTKHRLTRGLGGKIAVQYYTYWDGLERPTWEHEEELKQYGNCVVRYWAGGPVQVKGENAKYRRYRVEIARRAMARAKGERHVPTGYFVCCDTRERPKLYAPDIVGSYIYFKTAQAGWQLARVVGVEEDGESKSLPHTIKMLDLGKQYNVRLSLETLTTVSEERGTWCWHVHRRTRSVKNYKPSLE